MGIVRKRRQKTFNRPAIVPDTTTPHRLAATVLNSDLTVRFVKIDADDNRKAWMHLQVR
jgi:hypothetical protein